MPTNHPATSHPLFQPSHAHTYLDDSEGGDGRVLGAVWVIEGVSWMVWSRGCDPAYRFLGDGWPVGRGEGEAVVCSCVERIHLGVGGEEDDD